MEQLLTPQVIAAGGPLVVIALVLVRLGMRVGALLEPLEKAAKGFNAHLQEEARHHQVLEEQNEHLIALSHRQIELLIAIANATRGVPDEISASDVTPVVSTPLTSLPPPERAESQRVARRRRVVSGSYGPARGQ